MPLASRQVRIDTSSSPPVLLLSLQKAHRRGSGQGWGGGTRGRVPWKDKSLGGVPEDRSDVGPGMAGGRAPPQKKCMGASFMLSSHF